MTKEEKELLITDLCSRLPYGVICTDNRHGDSRVFTVDVEDNSVYYTDFDEYGLIENCKPYLRPMSSMTEEEKEEFHKLKQFSVTVVMPNGVSRIKPTYIVDLEDDGDGLNYLYDWLNKHHFDFRGLIEKGLALEALKDMYNN